MEPDNYLKLEKVQTDRYLYHLTCKGCRESIKDLGLNTSFAKNYRKDANLIFAHNTNKVSWNWYWLCLDIYDFAEGDYYAELKPDYLKNQRDELRYYVNKYYDIWKIDNEIALKEWYTDFASKEDNQTKENNYYVKCIGSITPDAVTLCAIDIDCKDDHKQYSSGYCKIRYNPIIPRKHFIQKHGFEPENEHHNNGRYLEMQDDMMDSVESIHKREWRKPRAKTTLLKLVV